MKYIILCISLILSQSIEAQNESKSVDSLKALIKTTTGRTKATHLSKLGKLYLKIEADSSLVAYQSMKKNGYPWDEEQLAFEYNLGMSMVYLEKSEYDLAHTALEKAEEFIKESLERKQEYFMQTAFLNYDQGNFTKAKDNFSKAIELLKTAPNTLKELECYNNMAGCSQQLGQYEEAIQLQQQALTIAKSLNSPAQISNSLNNLSVLYQKLEDYEASEKYILQSLKIDDSLGDKKSLVGGYINLGIVNRKIGERKQENERFDKARELYLKSLKLSEEIEYKVGKGASLANLALLENTLKNWKEGIRYGQQAVAFNVSQNNRIGEMISRLNLGESYRENQQYIEAKSEFDKSFAIAESTQFQQAIQELYASYSALYKDQKIFDKALLYYEKYKNLKDSLASTDVKNRINEIEIKYQTAEKENQILQQRTQLAEKELEVKQKNTMLFGGLGLVLIMALLGYLFYSQQKMKNRQLQRENELSTALARIETQNRLQEQRLRISRDLHDNIGSQLTFVISSIDNLKFGQEKRGVVPSEKLSEISDFTKHTIYELRDTIWAMNKNYITFEDLQVRISNFIDQARSASDKIDFSFTIASEVDLGHAFSSVEGMNIYRIIQEAVNNALKYSEASAISVSISEEKKLITIIISDNGRGFDLSQIKDGNGLKNMKKRAEDVDANLSIHSKQQNGTIVRLNINKN